MKKLIALVLASVCVLGLVGCSTKDEVIGKPVFETENIARVTFYGSSPNSEETEVPSEYLAEITEWLGTFVAGKKAEDVLPPGADSLFVRIEYSDGTIIENSMSTTIVDGITYLINYGKEPQCYFDLFTANVASVGGVDDPESVSEKWFDALHGDEMVWDGMREINLDEFPGVTFRWHSEKLEAVTDKETITLYTGMPIWSVYFCDLNGDGKREICSSVSFGSGMIDNRIIVADYANNAVHELSDRGYFDYYLTYRDGQLWAEKRASMQDDVLEAGPLVLRSVIGTDSTAIPMLMIGQSELQNITNADIVQGMEVGDIVYVGDIAIQKAPDNDDGPSSSVTRSTTESFEVKSFGGNTSVDKVLNLNSTYRYFYIYIKNTGSNTISVTIGNNSSTQSNNFHEIPTGNYYIWSTNQWAAQSHDVSFSSINGMYGSAKAMLCSTLAEAENHN